MSLVEFLQRYTDEIYHAADPGAAGRFIADPCLRHEPGELITMSLAENTARIAGFLERFPGARFENVVVTESGEHLTTVYQADLGEGRVLAGIEVFRVVDGRITETWNGAPSAGAWG
jgi:predicted SnoaL-like aldol condensation-catalyzing enzyme